MRIAVTGASGFCGSVVARLASAAGAEVLCLGRRPGPVGRHVPWDAARDVPDLAGADAVVHLAAAVGDGGREAAFRAVNVDGTRRLLDAAGGRPVVWVSSGSVYRPGPYAEPVREDHPIGGQRTAYGRTKAAGERLALAAGKVVLRPRAVYGPGDPHLRPRLRRVVRAGRAWLPGPDVPLSLTAVDNLASACLAAAGMPPATNASSATNTPNATSTPSAADAFPWPSGAYNIADERPYSRDEAVSVVLGVPVRHVPVAVVRSLAVVRVRGVTAYAVDQLTDGLVLDIGRALGRGWRPERTLRSYW